MLSSASEFPSPFMANEKKSFFHVFPSHLYRLAKDRCIVSGECRDWEDGEREERRSKRSERIEIDIQANLRYSKLRLAKTVSEFHIPPSYHSSHHKLFQLPEISLKFQHIPWGIQIIKVCLSKVIPERRMVSLRKIDHKKKKEVFLLREWH